MGSSGPVPFPACELFALRRYYSCAGFRTNSTEGGTYSQPSLLVMNTSEITRKPATPTPTPIAERIACAVLAAGLTWATFSPFGGRSTLEMTQESWSGPTVIVVAHRSSRI